MDLQAMRNHVRTYLDLDEEDLPDTIFDQFVENGTSKIIEREANWPFLEISEEWTPLTGVGVYDTATEFPAIEFITSVDRKSTAVTPLEIVWTGYKSRNNWPISGYTRAWTEYGGMLYLFPAPETDELLVVTGAAKVTGWTEFGASAEPPMPEPFHQLVLEWSLAETYFQQDDPDNGMLHANQFDQRLEQLWRRYMTAPRAPGLKVGSVRSLPTVGGPQLPSGF